MRVRCVYKRSKNERGGLHSKGPLTEGMVKFILKNI
jgi:hypothetical protein